MSQNKIDYPEQIYKAIDIITNKRLEALQYDITIEATIINDEQSEKGVYTVSNGNANFIAYSKDSEYKKNDVVMVTIPQGNYNNQKIIIGKKINEKKEESPIEFKRPFSNLINITNNILSNSNQKKEYSFIANGEKYCWDITASDILQSSYSQKDYISMELYENGYIGYTRVGVKADFLTTLKEYQVVSGNYGLEFILTFSNNIDPLSGENIIRTFSLDSSNFFGNIYNLDIYQNQELVFDISDMEKYTLKQIQICPYQRKNFKNINNKDIPSNIPFDNIFIKNIYICLGTSIADFNKDSVKITTKNSFLYSNNNEKNITYTQEDLKMFQDLRTDFSNHWREEGLKHTRKQYINWLQKYSHIKKISEFIEHLTTETEDTGDFTFFQRKILYESNVKILNLQWIHKNEDSNIIKAIQEDEIPIKCHVWWYIYDRESSDLYAGAGWKRFYGCKTIMNPKTGDYLLKKEEINNEELNFRYPEDVTDHLEDIYFFPNGNEQTQQLKVIIVKEKNNINEKNAFTDNSEVYFYDKVAESPIFIFENENIVANKTTKIEVSALSIRYEDKQKGMYSLYDEAGNISKNEDNQLRILSAVFDPTEEDVYEKPLLNQPYSSIKWIFPASNTMIVPIKNILPSEIDTLDISTIQALEKPKINENTPPLIDGKYYIIKDKDDNDKIIIRYNNEEDTFEFLAEEIDSNEAPLVKVGYYIKNTIDYASKDNTVLLEILKEGSAYNTSVSMQFGRQGTSGSDYTLEVEWEKNLQPIFDISARSLSGQVILKDKDANIIDPGGGTYNYKWYKVFSNGKTFDFKKEEKDIYYPVVAIPNANGEKATGVDWMWRKWDSFLDGASGLHYYHWDGKTNRYPRYWLWKDEVDTSQLATYDFINKKFIKISTANINSKYTIVYGKLKEEEQKDIIEFRPIDNIKLTPYKDGNYYRCGVFEINEKGESTYYYYNPKYDSQYTNVNGDKKRKPFIKYDDIYLIDPSPTHQENQTYYYPVYSNEKNYDYVNKNILKIQDNGEGNFTITDDKDNNRIPSMDDLYILEISLDNFLEYPLIARFPISFRNNHDTEHGDYIVNTVEGPTEVRYSTNGETDFKKNPYQISINIYDKKNNIYRTIKQGYGVDYDISKNKIPFGHWELIYDDDFNNIDTNFLPSLVESNEMNIEEYYEKLNRSLVINRAYGNDTNKQIEFLLLLKYVELLSSDIDNHFSDEYYTYQHRSYLTSEEKIEQLKRIKNYYDACLYFLKNEKFYNEKVFQSVVKTIYDYNGDSEPTGLSQYNLSDLFNYYTNLKNESISVANEIDTIKMELSKLKKSYFRDLELMIDKYNVLKNKDLYFVKPYLLPSKVYFKDTPICGIKFVINSNIGFNSQGKIINSNVADTDAVIKSNSIIWSSSIYFFQDNYPSKTLNQWNGKEIVTNKEIGIIQANGFSAGKKEPDNTFTGVVLGDWSKDIADSFITKQTGIFGFNHGAISYALKDDGTAFFGKDGNGRIYFDGTSAQIYSSQWIQPIEIVEDNIETKTYRQNQQGMMLDIDDGILKIKSQKKIRNNSNNLINSSIDLTISGTQNDDNPNFLLDVSYETDDIIYKKNGQDVVRVIEKTVRIYQNSGSILSDSNVFLRIGHNVKDIFSSNADYFSARTFNYYDDYININDHGGWIVSDNYKPAISSSSAGVLQTFPDANLSSTDFWGDTTILPFEGLVVDLTHGKIRLGNGSSIEGFQTGRWGTGTTDTTIYDNGEQRYFQISTGALAGQPLEGGLFTARTSDKDVFIEAIAQKFSDRIFRVFWDGTLVCRNIICDQTIECKTLKYI